MLMLYLLLELCSILVETFGRVPQSQKVIVGRPLKRAQSGCPCWCFSLSSWFLLRSSLCLGGPCCFCCCLPSFVLVPFSVLFAFPPPRVVSCGALVQLVPWRAGASLWVSVAAVTAFFPSNAFMASARSFNMFESMLQLGLKA